MGRSSARRLKQKVYLDQAIFQINNQVNAIGVNICVTPACENPENLHKLIHIPRQIRNIDSTTQKSGENNDNL